MINNVENIILLVDITCYTLVQHSLFNYGDIFNNAIYKQLQYDSHHVEFAMANLSSLKNWSSEISLLLLQKCKFISLIIFCSFCKIAFH